MPPKQIRIYETVCSTDSWGTCSTDTSGRVPSSSTAVSTMPSTRNIHMVVPMVFPASSGFFSPMCCPIITVVPMARLVIISVIICMKVLPVPTAEMLDAVPNWPTTKRSTAP